MNKMKLMFILLAWEALEKSLDDFAINPDRENRNKIIDAWIQFKEIHNS